MPDWLAGIYKDKDHLPKLFGKVKVMRLPAWTRGGLRTSVWGGTMIGITKDTSDFDTAWAYAKKLYLTRDMAQKLYESNCIISPVKAFWDSPFYDKPDPYFCGQAIGRLYIGQAPYVPRRSASPFNSFAKYRMVGAVVSLRQYAEDNQIYDVDRLEAQAHVLLKDVQETVRREMDRNKFAGGAQ
jgi:arabinosaccharide transport system substrate-binding protein